MDNPERKVTATKKVEGQYKKLIVNEEMQKPPVKNEPSEKERSKNEYQIMMQNFAANNNLEKSGASSKVPLKAF